MTRIPPEEQTALDLKNERKRASFSVEELTNVFYGGADKAQSHRKIVKVVENDPLFRNTNDIYFSSRTDVYKSTLAKLSRFVQLRREGKLDITEEEEPTFRDIALGVHPLYVHSAMFVPILKSLGNDEQVAKWVPLAETYRIAGCYAQTELGHGSYVQGLETTATFDPLSDEFIIHSPTVASTKYWPGGLGRTANFAVVYARLLLPEKSARGKNKDYGVHAFIVQLRSLEDHRNLPGIESGDLGSKIGTNANENGYCRFHHVRIPRNQMLMRYSQVSREGHYSIVPGAEKLSYGGMMLVRANIIKDTGKNLAVAATIAVRYCAVRRQFFSSETAESGLEQQVLDYQGVQIRLFPHIATAFALEFTGQRLIQQFKQIRREIESGDMSGLKQIHATLSGLKAVSTALSSDGIEECRRTCAGAGFTRYSGLPDLLTGSLGGVTVEGENGMIIQQTSQYLLKMYASALAGQELPGNMSYFGPLLRGPAKVAKDWDTPATLRHVDNLVSIFQFRAATKLRQLATAIENLVNTQKLSFAQAYAALQVEAIRAARAHGMATIMKAFTDTVHIVEKENAGLVTVLTRLCSLFGCIHLEKDLSDLLEVGYLPPSSGSALRVAIRELLAEIRPDAIPIVDAFDFADVELRSAIGRYDGRVYQTLLEWAKKEPLNQNEVVEGYEEYLKPILHSKVVKLPAKL